MASEAGHLLGLIRDSVATPQQAAARILSWRLSGLVLLQAAVLVSVLDALILGVIGGGAFVIPLPDGDWVLPPLLHAALLGGSLLLTAGALQVGGRILGGRGRFDQALLLTIWLEVIAIAVQVVQVALALFLPLLADLSGLAGVAVILWCMVHFTRVLHGFTGYGRAIGAIFLGALAVGLAVSMLLGFLGFGAPPDV
jgi:hypothetical protein